VRLSFLAALGGADAVGSSAGPPNRCRRFRRSASSNCPIRNQTACRHV